MTSVLFIKASKLILNDKKSNYTQYKEWDEIIYPFQNFNSATVEV